MNPKAESTQSKVKDASPPLRVFDLWLAGLKPGTRANYGSCIRRLFQDANLDPDVALERVKAEYPRFDTYTKLRLTADKYSDYVKHAAVFALHSFLTKGGVQVLPRVRIGKPELVKPKTRLTWDQALAVCGASSKPYNLTLKLMLHCGWGVSQFLKFNRPETWRNVKQFLASSPNAEYYRFDFTGRKQNRKEFYSLVPAFILREILTNCQVPICAKYGLSKSTNAKGKISKKKTDGVPLDMDHYHSARVYLETAFRTAVKRAPVTVQGNPSVHELRDCFRTRAAKVECASDAAEFAMGHTIDPLNYNKIAYDEAWMWGQLRKIYGPQAASMDQLKERDLKIAELTRQVNEMRGWMQTIFAKNQIDAEPWKRGPEQNP